ncbi:hypothetical protein ABB37_08123 [Leptomonas pyrrhocoris]|uniref:Uncharacterized protein n=1 Tax=Leptomonas pyrrhocoris TaxID=157538 RepID=A0A0M9FU22_LEPPY|nr:hypothetical protein ABB37_08123 [Leptomonas pyrrhocoris]KPA75967.1 hypothetical protein ABB37_08123 [Leptomonas pyrrhocoris]|eukprot:XP_015654406.1 hypothetical protein ABB37_08123 [Leptomonas pyrrhocoris]
MLRVVLQRFAVQRGIAKQLEALPLDELLRRMQSSSLTNPARSLESHFVLAEQSVDAQSSSPASPTDFKSSSLGTVLRNALSERLLAEVRHDIHTPHLCLDSGSLMLANCLRHRLSPLATQQIFALWLKFMQQGTGSRHAPSSPGLGSFSMLGLGRDSSSSGGGAQEYQAMQFQSLVRVLEACLDAQEQRRVPSEHSGEGRANKRAVPAASPPNQGNAWPSPVCFALDDWAELVDTVEQYLPLFADHGASTTSLLVQFTALALELTGSASSTPAVAGPDSRFANSLRRLSHLQMDRTLLQSRVFGLCEEAVKALCALESAEDAEDEVRSSGQRSGPWWHRPQELVRLSQARRRIEAYEFKQLRRGDKPSPSHTNDDARSSYFMEGDTAHHSASTGATSRPSVDKTRVSSGGAVRGARVGTHGHSTTSSSSFVAPSLSTSGTGVRWLPRLSTSWWVSSSSPASAFTSGGGAASAGHVAALRSGIPVLRVGRQLGGYVTYHALQQTTTAGCPDAPHANARPGCDAPSFGFHNSVATPHPPALLAVPLQHVLEIFATVCATASCTGAVSHVTTFAWWVRDVIQHQHGRRSLHDADEVASLLGIAELCLAYPDGTQTVLAEVMRCLQRSALFLWQAGDAAAAPHVVARSPPTPHASVLWPRACEAVASTLPLTTVRSEADRTLRTFVSTAQQALSTLQANPTSVESTQEGAQLLLRHRRYGVLILACLLLQRSNGYVSQSFSARIRELALALPFIHATGGPNELASAVRALYVITHPGMPSPQQGRGEAAQQKEDIAFYVLNQVTALLTPSAEAGVDKLESSTDAGLSRSLASLTITERQLLRSALRQVRASRTKAVLASTTTEGPLTEAPRLREHGSADASSADGSKGSPDHTVSFNRGTAAMSNASPSKRPSEQALRESVGSAALVSADRVRTTTTRPSRATPPVDYDAHVLQREIEAVSRHFGEHRSTLKSTS